MYIIKLYLLLITLIILISIKVMQNLESGLKLKRLLLYDLKYNLNFNK